MPASKRAAASTGNSYVDGLIEGWAWNTNSLSWSAPTLSTQYGSDSTERSGFVALNATQIAAAQAAFDNLYSFSLLSFTRNTATPGSADLRLAVTTAPEKPDADPNTPGVQWTAYGNFPDSADNGDGWFNNYSYNNPVLGTYAYQTFFHEIGHMMGLKHGHEAPAIPSDRNGIEFTTMTYLDFPGEVLDEGYDTAEGNFPQTFMMYDIAAIQAIYGGAWYGYQSGNTVYSFSTTTGETFIDGVGQGVPSNGAGTNSNVIFRTIWDGGGTDTYDFSNYTTNISAGCTDCRCKQPK